MNKKTLLLIGSLLALICIDIAGSYYLVGWRDHFWNGVKAMDVKQFFHDIVTFSCVAGVLILNYGYYSYLINIISIHSRKLKIHALFEHPVEKYHNIPNYQQRIENDTWMYYNLGYTILFGLIKAVGTLIVLLFLMVHMIHNPMTLSICASYVVIATMLSRIIAKPLIKINYDLQTLASDFRSTLCLDKFKELNDLNYHWALKTKIVNLFQGLYDQASVILPYLILSAAYFTGKITFGDLMAVGALISQVIQTAGFVIASQDSINNYRSCEKRLKELESTTK